MRITENKVAEESSLSIVCCYDGGGKKKKKSPSYRGLAEAAYLDLSLGTKKEEGTARG